jgi:hypothetical protein
MVVDGELLAIFLVGAPRLVRFVINNLDVVVSDVNEVSDA